MQPRSQSSTAISDVTSPVKLVGKIHRVRPRAIASVSKTPLVTRIARTGLDTRLHKVHSDNIPTYICPPSSDRLNHFSLIFLLNLSVSVNVFKAIGNLRHRYGPRYFIEYLPKVIVLNLGIIKLELRSVRSLKQLRNIIWRHSVFNFKHQNCQILQSSVK